MDKGCCSWFIDISLLSSESVKEWEFLLSLLTIEEQERVLKFHFFDDKKRSLFSFLLQKAATRASFGLDDDTKINIQRTVENKPYASVEGRSLGTWNYNVSHHGRYVGIVTNPYLLIGVDIVDIMTRPHQSQDAQSYVSVFEKQFHPLEYSNILSESTEHDLYTSFFIYWSLKEAYVKAVGIGLGFDLSSICFTITYIKRSSSSSSSSVDNRVYGTAIAHIHNTLQSDWKFNFHSLDHRHVMTVARGPLYDALPSYQDAAGWRKGMKNSSISSSQSVLLLTRPSDNNSSSSGSNSSSNSNSGISRKDIDFRRNHASNTTNNFNANNKSHRSSTSNNSSSSKERWCPCSECVIGCCIDISFCRLYSNNNNSSNNNTSNSNNNNSNTTTTTTTNNNNSNDNISNNDSINNNKNDNNNGNNYNSNSNNNTSPLNPVTLPSTTTTTTIKSSTATKSASLLLSHSELLAHDDSHSWEAVGGIEELLCARDRVRFLQL